MFSIGHSTHSSFVLFYRKTTLIKMDWKNSEKREVLYLIVNQLI